MIITNIKKWSFFSKVINFLDVDFNKYNILYITYIIVHIIQWYSFILLCTLLDTIAYIVQYIIICYSVE